MVVCKFFLQGTCRFGENCKFEHQINDGGQHHSSVLRQQNFPATNTGSNTNIDTNTLIRAVANDMIAAERGGQWLLSCYAPFKEKPNFPGFDEKSFEEVRLGLYEAQQMGTVNQFKEQFQMCLQAATGKLRSLQNPSQEAINTIKTIYNSSPGSMTNSGYGNTASSTFNNPSSNIFSNNQNPFGNTTNTNSIFSQPSNYGSTNVFAQNNQQQNSAPKSLFSTANQQPNTIFRNNPIQGSTNQSIFASQPQNTGNFATGANPFGPTYTNPIQPFNGMQQNQQVSSPFSMQATFPQQPTGIPAFNMLQQGGTAPYGTQQQQQVAAALPFASQTQQNTSPFGVQPQGNSPLMAAAQPNPTAPFVAAPFSTNPPQNVTPFSMQPQQQQQPPISATPFAPATYTQPALPFSAGNNVFSNNLQPASSSLAHTTNIFGPSNANILGGGIVESVKDESAYSKLEELSESDLKSYASDSFEFGKIPEKPPTIEMCL